MILAIILLICYLNIGCLTSIIYLVAAKRSGWENEIENGQMPPLLVILIFWPLACILMILVLLHHMIFNKIISGSAQWIHDKTKNLKISFETEKSKDIESEEK